MKIVKSLYGEKQAPKLWYDHFNRILLELEFIRCPVEPCLYKYYNYTDKSIIILIIHADDVLIIGTTELSVNNFLSRLQKKLRKISCFNPLEKYLGMDIEYNYDKTKVYLSQNTYIESKLEEKLNNINNFIKSPDSVHIPIYPTLNLRKEIPNTNNESLLSLIGTLKYLADRTRPDILVSTGECSIGQSFKQSCQNCVSIYAVY